MLLCCCKAHTVTSAMLLSYCTQQANKACLEVGCVGFAFPVCSARQHCLVVGHSLLGAVDGHHLPLPLPDCLQSVPLLRRQSFVTHLHHQTLQQWTCTTIDFRSSTDSSKGSKTCNNTESHSKAHSEIPIDKGVARTFTDKSNATRVQASST